MVEIAPRHGYRLTGCMLVCSVVVVVVGFAGRMVVSSVVVVLLVVRGSSEAQPDRAPMPETSRQESNSFFIILILSAARGAPAYASKRTDAPKLGIRSCRGCRLSNDDLGGGHFVTVLRVIDGHGSAGFHRFTRNGITVFIDVGCRL
jgi:hypothetical protein